MIIYLIFWDYPTKMEYVMDYKIISKVISKGELGRKKFIKEEFVLQKEPQKHLNLIHGVIVDKNNIKVKKKRNKQKPNILTKIHKKPKQKRKKI